ncbi:Dehydrogenase xptC like protein [Verticillium longisporum]|nr:Dehydrogenase xptC like protein [Verticillium longisporum]
MEAYEEIEGVEFPVDSGAGEPGAFWYPHSANPEQVTRSFALSEHWTGKATVRDNYETVLGQRVLRVLFDDKVAVGVEYVAAGAINASGARVILEASGIGGRALLEEAGIDVVADLPGVGANFQDHPLGGGASFTFTNWDFHPDSSDLQTNETFRAEAEAEFAESRTGPLTIASGNAASFLPFSVIAPSTFEAIASAYEAQDPAAYLPANSDPTLIAGYAAQKTRFAAALRAKDAAFYNLFLRGTNTEGSSTVFLHPLSRGTVHINTADPFFAQPRVDYRALSNPTDLDIQVEFVKFSRRYFLETSLAEFGPVEVSPGANVTSDEALREALRGLISPTCFHPVGTAAMLPRELGGVVDEKLLVYGVEKLSVIDASVQPDLPGAYTQQPVYAIAEKAADLIKARA